MSDETLNEEILRRISEQVTDENEIQEISDSVNEFLNQVSGDNRLLFEAGQFLGRQSFVTGDKRLYYASSALLCLSGLLASQNEGEPVSLHEAMDLADQTFDSALEDFDRAMASIATDAIEGLIGDE